MTNHWNDIQHADVIMCIGSNPAENHPISFKYVEKAMDQGAKLISVDPRYTRTSSKSNIYAQLRPGTDIAFIGGLINYVLQNDLIQKDYVVHYTNASFIIDDGFDFNEGIRITSYNVCYTKLLREISILFLLCSGVVYAFVDDYTTGYSLRARFCNVFSCSSRTKTWSPKGLLGSYNFV